MLGDVLDDRQKKLLINRIVQEVLHRIGALEDAKENVSGTLVLVTSYVPSPRTALEQLRRDFGGELSFVCMGAQNPFALEKALVSGTGEDDRVTEAVMGAARVVLLSPRISFLESISQGRDDDFATHLVIRSLLWMREVSVMLDFVPPRFRRNTLFEKLADLIAALEDMGMKILTYKCASAAPERASLVTEADVLRAWKERRPEILCEPRAIITPAARDKSVELGIRIN
ncbi:MAG: hypothetical protein LBO21_01675 [Synergistaceae bacterium]|nr:hypothetical protein [Synergistaceae bacterium]